MSWLVEYWDIHRKTSGSHAQMSEQLKYEKPSREKIHIRYFDDYNSAVRFANSLFDTGKFFTQINKQP
jgi:hypothetical protein